MAVFRSKSESETEAIGEAFARGLPDGAVVAMYGELGAGKTAFVRGMARGMGIDCRVSSPTFTIVNEYHYLARGAVCAVEWSENVSDAFFGDEIPVRIEKCGEGERIITIGEKTPC